MKKIKLLAVILLIMFGSCNRLTEKKIDLSGEWKFAMDEHDEGISEKWFNQQLPETVTLPGSMTTNGKGKDVDINTQWTGQIVDRSFYTDDKYAPYRSPDNFKIPFWLQPVKHYVGAAWYQKEVNIPETWNGQHVELFLERCHWESKLWINGMEVDRRNSLGTPHIFVVSDYIKPGVNNFTLCVDNRIKDVDPGANAHSISDHTQSNWNGIVGDIHLSVRPLVHIGSIQVYPEILNEKVNARIEVANSSGLPAQVKLELSATGPTKPGKVVKEYTLDKGNNIINFEYPMGPDPALWDEFFPNLYTLEVSLSNMSDGNNDSRTTTFGLRDFIADGRQLTINGRPVFLRGTLECAIFPKTGYPPTDVESWLRIINICKDHGLNHMRFHSWCPPKAAFEAADQAGFYLQPEASHWATIGDGKPIDKYLYKEADLMIEQYGNHPSFVMMTSGNEPGGSNQHKFLADYVNYLKAEDTRRLYASAAGWPNLPENDFMNDPSPRIQGWGAGLSSIINSRPPNSSYNYLDRITQHPNPVVSHEIGQWCVYPNFNEIPKYDGVLKAKNFEIFQETLTENGMAHLADSFLLASGKLQALCYKADIEAALRTPQFGGFQLLDLHDFPGQGSALVGVLDAFWEEKGYITPEEFRRFCNTTVPLALLPKHIYSNNETFSVAIEVAHYGVSELADIIPQWKVTDLSGQVILEGDLAKTDVPLGNGFSLGEISFPLHQFTNPQQLMLELTVDTFSNSWDFWVYPSVVESIPDEKEILIVQKMDEQSTRFLKDGGTVLLTLKKGSLTTEMGGDIKIGFSSIFWNTAWTRGQAPHTLGVLCNPAHPAMEEFPTQYHSNWQWWDAMSHSNAINLSSFPDGVQPIVRVIDDWFTNRPLALIFEAKVGRGKVLVSGIDLNTDLGERLEAQQLLYSLKKYMASDKFEPVSSLDASQLQLLTQ